MGQKVTLGGDRLGSGKKQQVELHGYSRSTHDLSYIWRSTMASGTLVPFMTEVGLPGDSFTINLNCDVKTHPTIGPLFGSYKVQLDVFTCPIRLYQGALHMNMLGIGLNMGQVKLPKLTLRAKGIDRTINPDNQQINPSCIFSYLNIRGLGTNPEAIEGGVEREFNGIPFIAYWDIYKQYYANKQEEIGVVIHNNMQEVEANIIDFLWLPDSGETALVLSDNVNAPLQPIFPGWGTLIEITFDAPVPTDFEFSRIQIRITGNTFAPIDQVFSTFTINGTGITGTGFMWRQNPTTWQGQTGSYIYNQNAIIGDVEPRLKQFDLKNIDTMRTSILQWPLENGAYDIMASAPTEPYRLPQTVNGENFSMQNAQEGLGIKTYNSDLFNNWISTEWIDGENGINEITRVKVTNENGMPIVDQEFGYFKIDELNMSRKIYDMLNRIAVSGGTYDDWLDATYTHERVKSMENPIYNGGLIQELVFQEVVSNAESQDGSQPLGTLAGRGVLRNNKKGGHVEIKVQEPCYIMGIISLTPRIDYSQGNKWDTGLKTMDDFHKPQLDEIGFQDLITDQMAWWDTKIPYDGATPLEPVFKSAGKQPAWINYMTNVNVIRGNFAEETEQMFMVLNRRYNQEYTGEDDIKIKDLTTYIDPSAYNHIFADTRRDAQNFWTQIAVDITARRKMSAKIMPNL